MRSGCAGLLLGFLTAVLLFTWSEGRAGRQVDWLEIASSAIAAAADITTGVAPATPTPRTGLATPARPSGSAVGATMATPAPAPQTLATAATGATAYIITRAELETQLSAGAGSGPMPMREVTVRLIPSNRVAMAGRLSLSVVTLPVEIEATLTVDADGAIRIAPSRIEAIGATLPADVTQALRNQVDDQGRRAINSALPPGSRARAIVVESDRIVVDLSAP